VFSFYWESSVAEILFQKVSANHKDNMIDCEIVLAMKIIVRFLHKLKAYVVFVDNTSKGFIMGR